MDLGHHSWFADYLVEQERVGLSLENGEEFAKEKANRVCKVGKPRKEYSIV